MKKYKSYAKTKKYKKHGIVDESVKWEDIVKKEVERMTKRLKELTKEIKEYSLRTDREGKKQLEISEQKYRSFLVEIETYSNEIKFKSCGDIAVDWNFRNGPKKRGVISISFE